MTDTHDPKNGDARPQKFRKKPIAVEVMGPTTSQNAAAIATWAHKSMPLASFFGWYVVKENETFELVSPAKFAALYELWEDSEDAEEDAHFGGSLA